MKKAVCVTSGGMDSITAGLKMLVDGYKITYLHFDYDQKADPKETEACEKIVVLLKKRNLPVDLMVIKLPFFKKVGKRSSLVNRNIKIPSSVANMLRKGIGNLWVPARNVVFMAYAASLAEFLRADIITWGANQSETGYGDNTMEFADRYTFMLELGLYEHKVKMLSPLYQYDKPQELKWGIDHGFYDVYAHAWSCDNGLEHLCGLCGCCNNRRMSNFVLEKIYGAKYKLNIEYMDYDWFFKKHLPGLVALNKPTSWKYKYLPLIRNYLYGEKNDFSKIQEHLEAVV